MGHARTHGQEQNKGRCLQAQREEEGGRQEKHKKTQAAKQAKNKNKKQN